MGANLPSETDAAHALKHPLFCLVFNHETRFQKHISFVETRFNPRNI